MGEGMKYNIVDAQWGRIGSMKNGKSTTLIYIKYINERKLHTQWLD